MDSLNCSNVSIVTTQTSNCQRALTMDLPIASTERIAVFSLIYGALFVLSLVGNSIVCIVILRNRDMRTVTNAFLVNLAVCDITFAVMNIPPLLALEMFSGNWLFGGFMCQFVPFCSTATTSASIYTMVAIAIDRRYAITDPLQARMLHTRRRTVLMILCVWIISFTVAIPHILTQTLIPRRNQHYCIEEWNGRGGELGNKIFTVALFAFLFIIPVVLIGTSYWRIIATLWKTNQALAEDYNCTQKRKDNHQTTFSRLSTIRIRKSRKGDSLNSGQHKRKTTLMLLTVVILFFICMLPFHISTLVVKLLDSDEIFNNYVFTVIHSNVFTILLVSSCAWNPLVYNFFSQKFNRAFRRVFSCQCEIRVEQQEVTTTVL